MLKKLKKELDKERLVHTLGVAYTAASLAMRYRADMQKAFLAGLLHDCAKCIPNKKKASLCREYGLPITASEDKNPFMLHAKLGAHLASKKYRVKDQDISYAILYHTTGRPDMGMLEKIIFVADYIEPGRDKARNLEEIRALSFQDIDAAVEKICYDTLAYLENTKEDIDPATRETYEYYHELNKGRSKTH